VARGHVPTASSAAPTTLAPQTPNTPATPSQPTSDVRYTDNESPVVAPSSGPRESTPTIPATTVPRGTDDHHGDDDGYRESEGGWGEDDD
jgi:hypothetical protein